MDSERRFLLKILESVLLLFVTNRKISIRNGYRNFMDAKTVASQGGVIWGD